MNRISFSKRLSYLIILWLSIVSVSAQVSQKIGNNPGTINPNAVLELESTTQGFLMPRMTAVQMAAITTPTSGMIVFCTDCGSGSDGELRISYSGVWQTFKGNLTGNISGNAATVTTNANLTGPITSVGNTTSVASQTGTGSKFVMDTAPTLVTPVLGVATATSVTSPIYASTPQALASGSAITWNPANGLNAAVTLDQNSTLSFSATPAAGTYGTLIITQDATGGRTLTLPSTANKVLGSSSTTTIALSSAPSAKDILNFYYDGTNCYWNIGQGYGIAATLAPTSLTSSVTGTLPVANGGTGLTSITSGQIPFGNGTSAIASSSNLTWNNSTGSLGVGTSTPGNGFNAKLDVVGRASFRTNGTNSSLIFDGYSPSGSLEVSRIFTDATSGTPSDFVLGTYPYAHSDQLYLKQSNGFVGIKNANPTTALDVNGTVTATSFVKSGGTSSQFLKADGSVDSSTYLTTAGTATNVSGIVALANGGTGSATKNFVDLTTTQTVAGVKNFSDKIRVQGIEIGQTNYQNQNTVLGYQSLVNNVSGNDNTAMGFVSMNALTSGKLNTGVGSYALNANSVGNENTAVGQQSLKNTTNSGNTGIGSYSLTTNVAGTNNTALGSNADVVTNALTNATAIGYGAKVSASHTIQLGNSSVTAINTNGAITGASFIKSGGISSQFLKADGTVDATAYAPLASPTFTGTPSLPTGTTGVTQTVSDNSTKLATTAYADAQAIAAVTGKQNTLTNSAGLAGALSDETGTGLAVFATSPTLVTPNLGTPSTLVGTNITGTASGLTAGAVTTNANLTGEVTSTGNATTVTNSAVIGKVLTGYTSGAGTVTATDNILQAIQKVDGNVALKAPLASPTFTGTPLAPTPTAGDNTTKVATTAFVTAINATTASTVSALRTEVFNGSAPNLVLGDFVGGGVVFWVNPSDNTRGLACAVTDQSTGIAWGTVQTGSTATAIGTGAANTDAMIAAQGATASNYAAGLARAYVGGGFQDWFLPSMDELLLMWSKSSTINPIAIANGGVGLSPGPIEYWSSSEAYSTHAKFLSYGQMQQNWKNGPKYVRAVRAVSSITPTSFATIEVQQTAQNNQIALKANIASPTFTGTVSGITSTMVGLGNVTNTSDANKPVSTATQTALDLKANIASPTFTGTPTLPTGTIGVTQTAGNSSTALATTAFVAAANATNANLTGMVTSNGNATTVVTNANLTGVVTSTGNATAIANGAITNVMLANGAVANLSGTNTGDQTNITGNAATVTTNANLTGPITSSGNTTSVASQTGTGSTFVMNTSPILVTPNLGTPSAVTLTNATGLPLTAGVSGILPVANGGTGLSSVGTNGQVLTTNGSGVASWATPFSVSEADEQVFATAAQTSFTLTQTPASTSKVKMYVNGIKINKLAYSVSGTTVTYVPANNNNYAISLNDRVQFEYTY